jgi:type II secretory pathway component PulF
LADDLKTRRRLRRGWRLKRVHHFPAVESERRVLVRATLETLMSDGPLLPFFDSAHARVGYWRHELAAARAALARGDALPEALTAAGGLFPAGLPALLARPLPGEARARALRGLLARFDQSSTRRSEAWFRGAYPLAVYLLTAILMSLPILAVSGVASQLAEACGGADCLPPLYSTPMLLARALAVVLPLLVLVGQRLWILRGRSPRAFRWLGALPLVGWRLRAAVVGAALEDLGGLLADGVVPDEALRVAGAASGFRAVEEVCERAAEEVGRGQPLQAVLSGELLPMGALDPIEADDAQGGLPAQLQEAGRRQRRRGEVGWEASVQLVAVPVFMLAAVTMGLVALSFYAVQVWPYMNLARWGF